MNYQLECFEVDITENISHRILERNHINFLKKNHTIQKTWLDSVKYK